MHCPKCGSEIIIAGSYDVAIEIFCIRAFNECSWHDYVDESDLWAYLIQVIAELPQEKFLDGEDLRVTPLTEDQGALSRM